MPHARLNDQFDADWPLNQAAIRESIDRLITSGRWSAYEGEQSELLRRDLSIQFARTHVQLCCTGTLSVELALRGCRVQSGDEVIMAGYDFPGNFRAIEAIGAHVVLVDIAHDGWSIHNVENLEKAYSPKTKAAIISHLHGDVGNMPDICDWGQRNGVAIVEDSCQAPGAILAARPIGSWGDVSVLSFGGSKLITAGRGGAVMTNDPRIDQRMRIFRDRGNDAFAMSELQSAALLPQLQYISKWRASHIDAIQAAEHLLSDAVEVRLAKRFNETEFCSFYKWGFFVNPDSSKAPDHARNLLVELLQRNNIRCGDGFRGFSYRTSNRCRRVGDLVNSDKAINETIIIHHTMLTHGSAAGEKLANDLLSTLDSLSR